MLWGVFLPEDESMRLMGVLFDFDGTLTEPGSLDFGAIRQAIGCPAGFPILEFIRSMPEPEARRAAMETLDRFEIAAAAESRPNAGAENLLCFIRSHGLGVGIISRNSLASIERALTNFPNTRPGDFDVILSRDDPVPPKPSPDGIREAAARMGVEPECLLVVGDYLYDIAAGHLAGARTVFLTNRGSLVCRDPEPDFTVDSLEQLCEIIGLFLPLPMGKLPNRMLGRFLGEHVGTDPAVLLGPRVGEDVAAVRLAGEDVLVLKSDPVTFVTDSVGDYAVIVNANDIAAVGARPRWLLSTLLLPEGSTAVEVRKVMRDLSRMAGRCGMTVCGGHTEITDAVTRPVVICQAAGTVSRDRLVDKRSMTAGDRILVTKGIAVEGSAIIAREFPGELERLGVPLAVVERCRRFLTDPGISVLEEAGISAESEGVTAMHDVTEGGIATALEELSAAGGRRIRIDVGAIPILEETKIVCRALGLGPLGLIASGSLLIACNAAACGTLMARLGAAGIRVTEIGEVLDRGEGVEAVCGAWPSYAVDELTRLYARKPHGLPEGRKSS